MVLNELKSKICADLGVDEFDLGKLGCDIIEVCAGIIDARLEEMEELEKENRRLRVVVKNLRVEIEDMREDENLT
jgi:hypothetical protein